MDLIEGTVWHKPAGARFSWNRYIRTGPKTEPLLTLEYSHAG